MKKICFAFNHFQYSDGVCRSAIAIANLLCKRNDVKIVLRPVFKMKKETLVLIDKNVEVKPVFGFYFNGFSRIIGLIPSNILHNIIFGKNKYDIEIGFQHGISTKAVVSSNSKNNNHYVWIHGYQDNTSMRKWYLKANKIICVSKYNADLLKKDLNNMVDIDYCYNPIDEIKIIEQGKEQVDIEMLHPSFITVGRLSPEKGFIRLINIIKKIVDEGYSLRVYIIGDGPQRNELKCLIEELKLEEVVKLLGSQINPHKYTSKCDTYICSSYSEGYSTSCAEAIILGIPVVSTKVSGSEEIINDSKCGLVVDNSDDGLYEGIKKVLEDQSIIDTWKNTLKITKNNFYSENRINKIEKVLNLKD